MDRSKSIDREIFSLSVPAVIATITTPLLGLMDTAFTGHMGGAVYIAAIALGSNVFNLIYWLFGFLRMGTSGLTAQAFGSSDNRAVTLTLYRSAVIALTIGVAVIAMQYPILSLFQAAMCPDTDAWEQATTYVRILVWGAPAVMLTTTLTGWFIGMRSTKGAMWMSLTIDMLNIIVSLALVIGLKMKVDGVAIGTLTAQWGGMIVGIYILLRQFKPSREITLRDILDINAIKRFASINFDIFLRTLCLIAVTLWFTRAGATQGTLILATNALLMQFFILFSYFTDGIAYAAEAMIGTAVGANNRTDAHRILHAVMKWGGILGVIFSTGYLVGGDFLLSLLSDDAGLRSTASDYIVWIITIPIVSFAAFMWDGICVGTTSTRLMLLSIAVATIIFFALCHLLIPILGNHGLWLAFTAYLLARSLTLSLFRPRFFRDRQSN